MVNIKHTMLFCIVLLFLLPKTNAQTPVAVIPFEPYNESIVLHVKLNNNPRVLRLLFDTGADGMAVTQALADTLGLKVSRQQNTSVVGGNMQISISAGNDVTLGSFTLKNQSIALFKDMGKELDGIIGNTMTRQYITKIDFDKKELSLYNFDNYAYEKGGTAIPINMTGVFIIPGTVAINADKPYTGNFVFDTGAAYHLICFRPFVRQNRLLVGGFKPEYQASTTSMGISSPTFNGKAASFSFANTKAITNMLVTLMAGGGQNESWKPGFDGSIGMRLIYRYNFTINLQKKEIYLTPNKNASHPLDFILGGYAFGFNLKGELAMQNSSTHHPDQKIKENTIITSINGITAQTILNNPEALKRLLDSAAGTKLSIMYKNGQQLLTEIITK
ncbi:hypothetical protein EZ428_10700 [Pedobacter frigiditerrae]|uniref:Aspartyl protease n=1 Tax=Pedobacter frigiditerrae TaxID=2530452 RepID=A0A4R0MY04_9SPHI|nr:retropepsin-like aspartic protease [Pedobacter frigiditerrae]TCC92189.1 hypothetical protein EZ428_10700 [Pedobacter frigiditerrae]